MAFYTYSVNGPKMIQSAFAGNDPMTGTLINLGVLAFLMVLQPVGGWLSDIIGRKTLLVFFGVGGVLYSWYLITQLPHQHDATLAFLTLAMAFVILTGYTSINAVVKAELFPTHVRALGVGLGYALANSLFGGTAPLLPGRAEDRPRRLVRPLRDCHDRGIVGGLCVLPHQQGPELARRHPQVSALP